MRTGLIGASALHYGAMLHRLLSIGKKEKKTGTKLNSVPAAY